MELETLEMIKNAYGVVCIVIAMIVVYLGMRGRYATTQGMLTAFSAVGILGISGVIALSSDASKIDWIDDWIITVPLIILSFGFVRYDGNGFQDRELRGWAWFAIITFLVIGSAQPFLTEIDTEPSMGFYFLLLITKIYSVIEALRDHFYCGGVFFVYHRQQRYSLHHTYQQRVAFFTVVIFDSAETLLGLRRQRRFL